MKRRTNLGLIAGLLVTCFVAPAALSAAAVDTSAPDKLIETASNAMLKDLDANRDKYRKDRAGLYNTVDAVLLPNFDVNYAGQQVLGQSWRSATADQRQRFIKAFYQSLLTTYGDALLEFTGDRMTILPYRGDPAATTATVRTEVKRSNGTPVPVNYSLRKTDQGWKAWDVTIEGISYVKNFRTDFGSEIDQNGLDAVIQRLETQNSKPSASTAQKS